MLIDAPRYEYDSKDKGSGGKGKGKKIDLFSLSPAQIKKMGGKYEG